MTFDLTFHARPSDYEIDLYREDGAWIASATSFYHGELVAQERMSDPPEDGEPNPDIDSEPGTEGPSPMRAHTRTSMAIEAKMIRCRACDGPHITQDCPAIRAALFAEDVPTAPQYELLAA